MGHDLANLIKVVTNSGTSRQWTALAIVLACVVSLRVWSQSAQVIPAPRADHHAHLFSPAAIQFFAQRRPPSQEAPALLSRPRTATDLIAALDEAHVQKAIVLSFAYIFAVPGKPEEEYSLVRGENDWVVQQVAQYPGRLVGFCGVNPLREYAVREIQRCKQIGLRGLKLHFSNPNTDIDLKNDQQLAQLKVVFSAANQARLPIIVHLRPRPGRDYGATQARSFIETVLPAAHDVPVQIAHMAGYGANPMQGLIGYDRATDEALGAFVMALRSGQIKRQNLYFDFSGVLLPEAPDEASRRDPERRLADEQQRDFPDWISHLESRIREIGIDHVLFGSSWPESTPATYQLLVREQLKLSLNEAHRFFENVAPYLK